jgi:hypothetical protein
MRRPEPSEEPSFRSLVIRVADEPNGKNQAALCRALPAATLFVNSSEWRSPRRTARDTSFPRGVACGSVTYVYPVACRWSVHRPRRLVTRRQTRSLPR